jgi:hypothetical protein
MALDSSFNNQSADRKGEIAKKGQRAKVKGQRSIIFG